jgi:hypothetical protein
LLGCALGAASFLVTTLAMQGGGAGTEPVRLMSWRPAAPVTPDAFGRASQAAAVPGDAPDGWQDDCAGECGGLEPVTMSPEEAIELRAEEDTLLAALLEEAALE